VIETFQYHLNFSKLFYLKKFPSKKDVIYLFYSSYQKVGNKIVTKLVLKKHCDIKNWNFQKLNFHP
jgi:hypothetical protein